MMKNIDKPVRSILAICLLCVASVGADGPLAPSEKHAEIFLTQGLGVIETQLQNFEEKTKTLVHDAEAYCTGSLEVEVMRATLIEAYKSWVALDMYQFGPIEKSSAVLSLNFWPDKKGFVPRHLEQIFNLDAASQQDPNKIRALSAAAQGFPALILLVDQKSCPAVIGVSKNIALYADEIKSGWLDPQGWRDIMQSAGPDNPVYLNPDEASNEIYASAVFGISRIMMRLQQPLGHVSQPIPTRVEAAALGDNTALVLVQVQLEAVELLLETVFYPVLPEENRQNLVSAALALSEAIEAIEIPLQDAVQDPEYWVKVDGAVTRATVFYNVASENIGKYFGISEGFSAADGD